MNKILKNVDYFTNGKTYSMGYDPNYYGGRVIDGNIAFHSPSSGIPYQTIYHEVAHSIDDHSNGYFTKALESQSVNTQDGAYVMGGPLNNYARNSRGYKDNYINEETGLLNVEAQQHPGNVPCASNDQWCIAGNTPGEEWADLVANYTAGNFSSDKYGTVRSNWVKQVWFRFFHPAVNRHDQRPFQAE